MGRIASVSFSLSGGKVAFFRKRRGSYFFEGAREEKPNLKELKDYRLYLAYFYPDLVSEVLELPAVKNERIREILLKKKLSDTLGTTTDYLVSAVELEESSPERKVYRVFGIPREVYESEDILPEGVRGDQEVFTLEQLSLLGISMLISPELTLFHIFSDREKLIVTVSKGKEILYTRSVSIPSYTGEMGSFKDFLYENINMTYIFVAQRSGIKVDLILVSGKAKDEDGLIESLINLVPVGIATPLVPSLFKNTTPDTFHSFMTCFGTLNLPEEYDLSPAEVKEKRELGRLLGKAVPLSLIALLLSLLLFGWETYSLIEKKGEVEDLREKFLVRTSDILSNPLFKNINYYAGYLELLDRSRKNHPFIILKDAGELVKMLSGKRYEFYIKNSKAVLVVEFEKTFPNLIELNLFRDRLTDKLKGLKGISYRIENERKDLENNRLALRLVLERKL